MLYGLPFQVCSIKYIFSYSLIYLLVYHSTSYNTNNTRAATYEFRFQFVATQLTVHILLT